MTIFWYFLSRQLINPEFHIMNKKCVKFSHRKAGVYNNRLLFFETVTDISLKGLTWQKHEEIRPKLTSLHNRRIWQNVNLTGRRMVLPNCYQPMGFNCTENAFVCVSVCLFEVQRMPQ